MMRRFSKLLFPHLPSDLRERRMNTVILVVIVSAAAGLAIAFIAMSRRGF